MIKLVLTPITEEVLMQLKRMSRLPAASQLRPAYFAVRIKGRTILASHVRPLPGYICVSPLKGNGEDRYGEDRYPLNDVEQITINWRPR